MKNAKGLWFGRCPRFALSASLRLRSHGGSISHLVSAFHSLTSRRRSSRRCVHGLSPETPQRQLAAYSMSSATTRRAPNRFRHLVSTASLSALVRERPLTSLLTFELQLTAISVQLQRLGFSSMSLNSNQPSPNHALQRTASLTFSYRRAAVSSTGSVTAHAAPSPRAASRTRALPGRGR